MGVDLLSGASALDICYPGTAALEIEVNCVG